MQQITVRKARKTRVAHGSPTVASGPIVSISCAPKDEYFMAMHASRPSPLSILSRSTAKDEATQFLSMSMGTFPSNTFPRNTLEHNETVNIFESTETVDKTHLHCYSIAMPTLFVANHSQHLILSGSMAARIVRSGPRDSGYVGH